MSPSSEQHKVLWDILKRVSRSFYLTLRILPQPVRSQIGLAYLLARAADTIADTGELDDDTRLASLGAFKTQLGRDVPEWGAIQKIQARIIPRQANPDERRLLEELEACFRLYQECSVIDRSHIQHVLSVLIGGMEFDIQRFPKNPSRGLQALETRADLEYYTYAVAGCVGEFWTKMVCTHLPGMKEWDQREMIPLGVRFGKGLQMVNILRDIAKDLQNSRCYIPTVLLQEFGLSPEQLLHPESMKAFRPLYKQLIKEARDHLDYGWGYTMAIPRLEVRLRLACMWPVLIGIRTLQQLSLSSQVLEPQTTIKVSRGEVYRLVAATGLTGGCGYVGTAYWGYWRKRIV